MKKNRHIRQILIRSIGLAVLSTLAAALIVAIIVISNEMRGHVEAFLTDNLDDTISSAEYSMSVEGAGAAVDLIYDVGVKGSVTDEALSKFVRTKTYSSVDLVSSDGTIMHSSDKEHVGLNYNDDQRTKAFLDSCMEGSIKSAHVDSWPLHNNEPYHLINASFWESEDEPLLIVIGLDEKCYGTHLLDCLVDATIFSSAGNYGYILLCDDTLTVIGCRNPDSYGKKIAPSHDINKICDEDLMAEETLFGQRVYLRARRVNPPMGSEKLGGYLIAAYLKESVQTSTLRTLAALSAFWIALFMALDALISHLIRRHVTNRMVAVNRSLDAITAGDLDERVEVTDSIEFEDLSRGINTTVDKLENLIHQEATRLNEELALARTIQKTALPNVFPPFPERCDFGLYASMDVAEEVGGDFYDFFFVSNDKIAVIVADVSDKGIPAAMFMMRTKAAIKNLAVSGLSTNEVIAHVNKDLCEDNEAGMFVTVWFGILNLRSGVMEYVHAGHTCPVLFAANRRATLVQQKRDFIVGARANVTYHRQVLQLGSGDALFLYSDGVTEAFSITNEQYGSKRLANVLAQASSNESAADPNTYCEAICKKVKADVDAFSTGTEQSDDITMLCIRFEGQGQP